MSKSNLQKKAEGTNVVRTTDTYVDANGNKIVEPVFNGGGGNVGGMIGIKR